MSCVCDHSHRGPYSKAGSPTTQIRGRKLLLVTAISATRALFCNRCPLTVDTSSGFTLLLRDDLRTLKHSHARSRLRFAIAHHHTPPLRTLHLPRNFPPLQALRHPFAPPHCIPGKISRQFRATRSRTRTISPASPPSAHFTPVRAAEPCSLPLLPLLRSPARPWRAR